MNPTTNIIAVIDYGLGNLRSVARALATVAPHHQVIVTHDAEVIRKAERVVFPGQSAIRDCMAGLVQFNLIDVIREAAQNKPFFGMCIGPQALMTHSSENGGIDTLAILSGQTRHFPPSLTEMGLKIPHMGWNTVQQTKTHPLWQGIADNTRFYFVHSYYLQADDAASIVGSTDYGIRFTTALAHDNIFAVQFHPEKSADQGLRLLRNFVAWQP